MRFLTTSILTSMVFATVAFTPTSANAQKGYVASIAGVWTGRGTIQKSSNSPKEAVRCRLKMVSKNKGGAFYVRYFCLGIDIKFETTGTLSFNQKTKVIAGKLVTVGVGAFRAKGKLKGKNVSLTLSGKDKKTGKPVKGSLSIRQSGKTKLSSSLSAIDVKTGKRFQAFKASFKKQ